MTKPVFLDQRIQAAAERLLNGDIKLLSLDIFDTLIYRRVPRAPDVFLQIGTQLQNAGLLCNGQKPDSFAAIRYQTEYARRAVRQKIFGDREITLEEIYEHFPRGIVKISAPDLVEREVKQECALCSANEQMVAFAKMAKDAGFKLALITNSYFSETAIGRILAAAIPHLPAPDKIFVSAAHRKGKRDGLMKTMCKAFSLQPSEILHLGDNPVSDRQAAQETGLAFIDYSCDETFEASLVDEQPRQWWQRADAYAQNDGDSGLTALRKQAGYWRIPDELPETHQPFYRYGSRFIAPLLTVFTGWAAARLAQQNAHAVYGLLREGDFLTQLLAKHDTTIERHKLAVSRLTSALSCFTPDHPQYLEDFLTRRGFWSIGMLMEQLGFTQEQAKIIDDPAHTLEHIPAPELTNRLVRSPLATELYERSATRRKNLLAHLRGLGALDHNALYLFDLGYAATIQRGLQRIFSIEKMDIVTHGLYLATAHVSLGTQLAGGIVEGFLAQNGNPNDFACAFCRCPEVVEVSCMPDYGSVCGYEENGSPIFADDAMSARQIAEVKVIQQATMAFADRFLAQAQSPDFLQEGWREQMRALAMRIIAHPTAEEAGLLGHWMADSDMGLTSPRPIVSAGPHQHKLATLTPPELAALPRRDVPWVFGVAASISPAHCRQVARIILQHEKPESFRF